MENYVLYDEVGRGERSVVYKGRKKGSVEFVAIHCVEKCKRLELQNIVRLTHELDHPNVVRFYEWYETTNHIWMVVELCTGDSLDVIVCQDSSLPEVTIKHFGAEIAKGLFYIHSLGIMYCDLTPSNILLDGSGNLKLSDFALARVEGEEDFFDFIDNNDDPDSDDDPNNEGLRGGKIKRPKASPHYMAPEVIMGTPHGKESDLWSLGCLLYELFSGKQPFMAESFEELAEKILGEDCPDVKQRIEEGSVEGSGEFSSLIKGLLQKDPPQRFDWLAVIRHPFWDHGLDCLLDEGHSDNVEQTGSKADVLVLDEEHNETEEKSKKNNDSTANHLEDVIGEHKHEKQVLSVPEEKGIKQGTYTYRSKPQSADSKLREMEVKDKKLGGTHVITRHTKSNELMAKSERLSVQKAKKEHQTSSLPVDNGSTKRNKAPFNRHGTVVNGKDQNISQSVRESSIDTSPDGESHKEISTSDVSDLIYHPSDFVVSPIVDNPKIKKISIPKFDSKALPCQSLKPDEIIGLSEEKLSEHFRSIVTLLSQSEKSGSHAASLQRSKLHTASYLASLCRHGAIANIVFESELVPVLLQQVKNGFSSDFKGRIGYILGLLAGNATLISEDFHMTEVFSILTEVIRDNFRNARLKKHLLPALGEFLFYAATQEENEKRQITKWDVPGVTFTIITRCLHEGEDIEVQHFAAKTIELVATTHGRHCTKLVTNDTAQLLWKLFTHCTVDIQKVTAISALCRLTYHSAAVFQHVVEKAGFKAVIDSLSTGVPRIQQAIVTMFAALLIARPQAKRLVKEKDFITKVMHLFESPSTVIRGKTFLVVLAMIQLSREALLSCCQARLVTHIEKDQKRGTPVKGESPENHTYLMACLRMCMEAIIEATPDVLRNVITALDVVSGRRHPSAGQTKQLRTHLPLLSIILHLVTSHVFRARIITEVFLRDIGSLLAHIKSIDAGSTSIGSAAGPSAAEDLTYVVLSIVESITQHPPLLLEHHGVVVESILPSLAAMVSSSNGNTRVLCFRMFSDVASLYLDNENVYNSSGTENVMASTRKLDEVISQHLLPQYHMILQDQDPLPAYGLKLLASLLERSQEIVKNFIDEGLLFTLSQIVNSHAGEGNIGMIQSIVGLLDCVLSTQDIDMTVLYQQGLIDSVTSLFVDVVTIMNEDSPDSEKVCVVLLPLLDTVNNILKYVSKEVRRALQAKNEGVPNSDSLTQVAEALLMETKPLAHLTGVLINYLCHKDTDIQEWACKSLYLLAELFGGVYEDAMSIENMECLADALEKSDDKRRKQLLRIIKRMVSSNPSHASSVVNSGQRLVNMLVRLKTSEDSSGPEATAIQALAHDVLIKIGITS